MNQTKPGNQTQAGKVRLTADNWIALVGMVIGCCGAMYYAIDNRFSSIEDRIMEHEIRITKREANAFTAQEAIVLSNNVAGLTIELKQQEKMLERHRTDAGQLQTKIDVILSSLQTTPADVYDLVKKLMDEEGN